MVEIAAQFGREIDIAVAVQGAVKDKIEITSRLKGIAEAQIQTEHALTGSLEGPT